MKGSHLGASKDGKQRDRGPGTQGAIGTADSKRNQTKPGGWGRVGRGSDSRQMRGGPALQKGFLRGYQRMEQGAEIAKDAKARTDRGRCRALHYGPPAQSRR